MSPTQTTVPQIDLNDGNRIPQLGFGVFQIPPEETEEATLRAFEVSYRHVDTAAAYRNEAQVGQAIRASGLESNDVFVTTKCFNDSHGYDAATRALKESLERLELDHVDLYLIHWPVDGWEQAWETMAELYA